MNGIFSFVLGFAAGWLSRSIAASSREAALDMGSFGLDLVERLKRAATLERERLDDFVAEVRSRADEWRATRAPSAQESTTPAGDGGGRASVNGGSPA